MTKLILTQSQIYTPYPNKHSEDTPYRKKTSPYYHYVGSLRQPVPSLQPLTIRTTALYLFPLFIHSFTPIRTIEQKDNSDKTMGNLCSRSANEPDPFATPGRVLGASSTTNQPSRAPVPQKIDSKSKAKVGGPPRTLGGSGGYGTTEGGDDDARGAAAKAAEVCTYPIRLQINCYLYRHTSRS